MTYVISLHDYDFFRVLRSNRKYYISMISIFLQLYFTPFIKNNCLHSFTNNKFDKITKYGTR
jgi:hypothetical protein